MLSSGRLTPKRARPQWLPQREDAAGLLLALAVGGAALLSTRALPKSPYLSDILVALLAGALVVNTPLRRLVGLAAVGQEREADRYAAGLRYVGKWVLRLGIVFMGFKVRTELVRARELLLVAGVIAAALPSVFLLTHAASLRLGVRRPMADLVAGGTMICGSSAVNALAPVVGARREDQGVAVAAIFLFSVVALLCFQPIAALVGLDTVHAGLWSGLAVNDLSSAVAVGKQMGGDGGVVAAAAKSARVLLLAPLILILAVARGGRAHGVKARVLENIPRFVFGYLALAILRIAGDRLWGASPTWLRLIEIDRVAVDVLLVTVAASIGLHLQLASVLGSGLRALAIGGAASVWMATLSLSMIVLTLRGQAAAAALVGGGALLIAALLYRAAATGDAPLRLLRVRFAAGLPVSLAEATLLLEAGEWDDEARRRLLRQLHPSIGELIPARESAFAHGDGTRWLTYWQGASGWALVAVCRDPGSLTPVHAHSHRLLAKTIEGSVEELTFREEEGSRLCLTGRKPLAHDELVETEGLAAVHAIRNAGRRMAIDLQLRGPEQGAPGRRLRPRQPIDLVTAPVGTRFEVALEVDDRPGHAGEGPAAGKPDVPQGSA